MVTYYALRMTTTCSTLIGRLCYINVVHSDQGRSQKQITTEAVSNKRVVTEAMSMI